MRVISLLFLAAVLVTACSDASKESFTGSWQMNLEGDFNDIVQIVIDEHNKFNSNHYAVVQGNSMNIEFKGSVEPDGKIFGIISIEGRAIGDLNGLLNINTGEGAWKGYGFSGTWNATKKK